MAQTPATQVLAKGGVVLAQKKRKDERMTLQKRHTIIFDMDGVLFDTERLSIPCWEAAGLAYGISGMGELSRACIGTTAVRTKEILTGSFDHPIPYDEIRAEKSRLMHESFVRNGMPVKPGVFELMDWLKENGFAIGLATSTRRAAVEEELAMCGLDRYFDVVVCGDELKRSKPAPDIFIKCGGELQAVSEETWVIEDSYNGIRAAHAAGMKPVMVPDLLAPDEEMRSLAVQICGDLFEVRSYLERQF
ncbi:MAG: HAD family phosphatase [Eubacteriales bacterium]|nr:HAD family phosphatase [Eubacteriales bacterium]